MEGGVGVCVCGGGGAGNLNVAGELCMYDHTFLKCYRERFSSRSPPFPGLSACFSAPPPLPFLPDQRPTVHTGVWQLCNPFNNRRCY